MAKKPTKKRTKKQLQLSKPPVPTPLDGLMASFRALFGVVAASKLPIIGDMATAFVGALFPTPMQKRLEDWFAEVHWKFNALARRGMDVEALRQNPVFADLMISLTQAAMRTHSEKKRVRLGNALVNAALRGVADETKQHMFVRMVGEFSDQHVQLLELLADPAQWFESRSKQFPRLRPAAGENTPRHVVDRAFPQWKTDGDGHVDLLRQLARELNGRGLIVIDGNGLTSYRDPVDTGLTTPFGDEFLRFIGEPP